jgi:DUF1365 family protein
MYRLFYFALDLDELDLLHHRLALFSVNRANFFSFHERDFLPTWEPLHNPTRPAIDPNAIANLPSLKSRVRALCAAHGADFGSGGRVVLITLPRVLGYSFISRVACSVTAAARNGS